MSLLLFTANENAVETRKRESANEETNTNIDNKDNKAEEHSSLVTTTTLTPPPPSSILSPAQRYQCIENATAKLLNYPSSTVFCNVYDLTEANSLFSSLGVGMHHAGIEVYGVEYAFGLDVMPSFCERELELPPEQREMDDETHIIVSHSHNREEESEEEESSIPQLQGNESEEFVGVVAMPPRNCPPHIFREQFVLGNTMLSSNDVDERIAQLRAEAEWQGNTYHLIRHNCLHFAERLANILLPPEVRYVQYTAHPCTSSNTLNERWEYHYNNSNIMYKSKMRPINSHPINFHPIRVYECPYREVCQLPNGSVVCLPRLIPPHIARICRLSNKYLPSS